MKCKINFWVSWERRDSRVGYLCSARSSILGGGSLSSICSPIGWCQKQAILIFACSNKSNGLCISDWVTEVQLGHYLFLVIAFDMNDLNPETEGSNGSTLLIIVEVVKITAQWISQQTTVLKHDFKHYTIAKTSHYWLLYISILACFTPYILNLRIEIKT